MKLIDKDTLVAEIERRKKILQRHPYENHKAICHLDSLEQKLNKFEVKEADLEKDIKDYIYEIPHAKTGIPGGWRLSWHEENVIEIAKHFYNLGLAQKGE